ncbi:guided entry of tail-anchored proteins factor 1 [Epargyreus clarus]|uniref:guided entry of tail-anchored proteins factor 1 n=1 Tax=Epargyreus clarus TaxID=520877 RepID=UPI003C2CE20E
MLEVINGFLLVYLTILCAVNVLVPSLVKPIVACFARPSNEERTIWGEILKLKAEQKTISMKDEFAAYSKLQRRINKLETELKDISQSRMRKSIAIKGSVHLGLQVLCIVVMFCSIVWYRREPIVTLKGNLFPLTNVLTYPSNTPNAISTHIWVLITNVSFKCLIKPFMS